MDFGIRWPNSVYNGIIAKCREILETSFIIMIQSDTRPISWKYIDVSTFLLRILFEFKGVFFIETFDKKRERQETNWVH